MIAHIGPGMYVPVGSPKRKAAPQPFVRVAKCPACGEWGKAGECARCEQSPEDDIEQARRLR